jgi:small-conductance mechanosensitive channel
MPLMPDTKTHYWREAGLTGHIEGERAKHARRELVVLIPLIAAVLVAYDYRDDLFGNDVAVRVVTVIVLVILGWAFARAVGRALGPMLFRRLDPGTAGTVGFLIRLATIGLAVLVALRIAGLKPETLAVGGAVTAVVLGLAAQQTIGNLFAGTVLLSARPFRVGDRVRLTGGAVAGEIEGTVSSLGLLYTTLANGDDNILVPNNVVLNLAIIPLREPDAVDLRARLRAGVRPSDVQRVLTDSVSISTRKDPRIVLEEIDGDEVVVRVAATPVVASEGPRLADEMLSALADVTRDGEPVRDRPAAGDDERDRQAQIAD